MRKDQQWRRTAAGVHEARVNGHDLKVFLAGAVWAVTVDGRHRSEVFEDSDTAKAWSERAARTA
jgi:hypothetical protein